MLAELVRMSDQIGALVLAGAGGAYVRAVFMPQPSWRRRMLEGFAGAIGAIFLGGIVGHFLDKLTGSGTWAYFAAGFLMGEGGYAGIQAVRGGLLGKLIEKEKK